MRHLRSAQEAGRRKEVKGSGRGRIVRKRERRVEAVWRKSDLGEKVDEKEVMNHSDTWSRAGRCREGRLVWL